MNEERLFILKMIEEGKITAEEGAALLEALRDDAFEPAESAGERTPAGDPDDGTGQAAADSQERVEEHRAEERRAEERKGPGDQDRKARSAELGAQIKEAIGAAIKGVPHVTDELKDNWKEVREDVRQSFHEIREEIRKKGLVDVSGLMELISHVRDVGFGQSHEFKEEIEGSLTDESPRIELSTANGSIKVRGWDEPGFRLILRKRVHAVDEERAKEIAQEMVDLNVDDTSLRATVRHVLNASVSMELWIPKVSRVTLEVQSKNGSIRLEDIEGASVEASTTNGSITVDRVRGRVVTTRTTNGKISCSHIQSEKAEARTTNGSITWGGSAQSAELKTVNGSARLAPRPVESSAVSDASPSHPSRFDVSTVNGSVHIDLPEDDGIGVSVVAKGRSVKTDGESDRLSFVGEGRGERRAKTPGYDESAQSLELLLHTVNGAIRLHSDGKGSGAGSDKGGDTDSGGTGTDS